MDENPQIGTIVRLFDNRRGKIINIFHVHINGASSSSKVFCIKIDNSRTVVKLASFQFDIVAECPGAPPSSNFTQAPDLEEHLTFHTSNRGQWSPYSPVSRTFHLINEPSSSTSNNLDNNAPSASTTSNINTSNNISSRPQVMNSNNNSNENLLHQEELLIDNNRSRIPLDPKPSTCTSSDISKGKKRVFDEPTDEDIDKYISENENKNTAKKTKTDMNILAAYLEQINETRKIENIPPEELNTLLCKFFMSVKKPNGSNYEPVSLRSMLASFQRYLKRQKYPYSILESLEFTQLQDVFKRKKEELKKDGKGNKPNAADALTPEEIQTLYDSKELSCNRDPDTLLRTLWFYNSVHFGMRGVTEHHNMKWGDVELLQDSNGEEYIQYNERNTKTRTGVNTEDTRAVKPKAWANKKNPNKCPVAAYKSYLDKRPTKFSNPEDPFYIAKNTNTEKSSLWFKSQRVGVNTISSFMKKMAVNAGLDTSSRKISNSSTRKYMIQKLNDNGVEPTKIMQISGHKNVQSINSYSHLSMNQQKNISNILSGDTTTCSTSGDQSVPTCMSGISPPPCTGNTNSTTSTTTIRTTSNLSAGQSSLGCIFGNIYGGTFNVHIHKHNFTLFQGGSLGKGTGVRYKSDVDLLVVLNDFSSIEDLKHNLPEILTTMENFLETELSYYLPEAQVNVCNKTPWTLQFRLKCYNSYEWFDVDLLPIIDVWSKWMVVFGGKQATYDKMENNETLQYYYGKCLAKLQVEFVKPLPAKAKDLIRLLKYWKKTQNVGLSSYGIELLVMHVWENEGRKENFTLKSLMSAVVKELVNYRHLKICWDTNYNAWKYCRSLSAPYILDPANPFNNLASRDWGFWSGSEIENKASILNRRLDGLPEEGEGSGLLWKLGAVVALGAVALFSAALGERR